MSPDEELAAVKQQLVDATFELRDIAGPIAYRIRMYRAHWQRENETLREIIQGAYEHLLSRNPEGAERLLKKALSHG